MAAAGRVGRIARAEPGLREIVALAAPERFAVGLNDNDFRGDIDEITLRAEVAHTGDHPACFGDCVGLEQHGAEHARAGQPSVTHIKYFLSPGLHVIGPGCAWLE